MPSATPIFDVVGDFDEDAIVEATVRFLLSIDDDEADCHSEPCPDPKENVTRQEADD